MKPIIDAICNSNKLMVTLNDGTQLTVHPYFILKSAEKDVKVLRGFIEGSEPTSCDIGLERIRSSRELPQPYAINPDCLKFDFSDYEIVFPRQGDLNRL